MNIDIARQKLERTRILKLWEAESDEGRNPEAVDVFWKTPANPAQLPDDAPTLFIGWEAAFEEMTPAASAIPFSELLLPWVAQAIQDAYGDRPRPALKHVESDLLRQLSAIVALPLSWWFSLYSDGGSLQDSSHPGRQKYHAFVDWMKRGGWSEFFDEYPVLEELVSITLTGWIHANREFAGRLDMDAPELAAWLLVDPVGYADITSGLSDPHNRQHSVFSITSAGETRVAYKPRSLSTEQAFAQLIQWLAVREPSLSLNYAPVLSRPEYGWMRWIKTADPGDPALFYERAGMLQCLLQILGATDAHIGNCVATPQGPVLIDCECLLTPVLQNASTPPQTTLQATFRDIESTGLLGRGVRSNGEPDLSGLTGHGGQPTGYLVPVWDNINTDAMQVNFRYARLKRQHNEAPALPRIAACEAFIRGYSAMYLGLCHHRDPLLADVSLMAALKAARVRILVRDTRKYTLILSRSIHPRYLRDAGKREQAIRAWLRADPLGLPVSVEDAIVDSETESIQRLDIPAFHSYGGSCDLHSAEHRIVPELFAQSGYERAAGRLADVTPAALAEHQQALRLKWLMSL